MGEALPRKSAATISRLVSELAWVLLELFGVDVEERPRILVKKYPGPLSTSYLLSGWFSLFGLDSYSNFLFQLWANPNSSTAFFRS